MVRFDAIKSGTLFVLDFDGCCYTKIGAFAMRPNKPNTYNIPPHALVTVVCDCLTKKEESL